MDALRLVFYFSAALCLLAAVFSYLRGKRYVYDEQAQALPQRSQILRGETNAIENAAR